MLAGAGVDRQHEHEPSWAPRPVGHGGRCDRELHADADRRVYACQPAVSQVRMGAVGGLVHLLRRDSARAGRLELAQAPERSVRSSRWLVQWRSLGSMVHWTAGGLGPSRTKVSYQGPSLLLGEVQIKTRPHRGDFLRFQLLCLAIAVPVTSGHVFFHDGPVPINPTPTVDDNSAAAANKQRLDSDAIDVEHMPQRCFVAIHIGANLTKGPAECRLPPGRSRCP